MTAQAIAAQLAAGEAPTLDAIDAILDIDTASAVAHVQGGVTWGRLDTALARRAFTLGPLPDGLRSVRIADTWAHADPRRPSARYGQLTDAIIAVRAALPDGRVTHASVSPRRAVGPDLPRCALGGGFAAGVLCEAHIQAWPRPRRIEWHATRFDDWSSAMDAVVLALRAGVPTAWIEIARAAGRVQLSARVDCQAQATFERFKAAVGGEAAGNAEARYRAAFEASGRPLVCVFSGPRAEAARVAASTRGARILGVAPHAALVFARDGKRTAAPEWIALAERLQAELRKVD